MQATQAPAARTDMAKEGRKYGNLNIYVVARLSYGIDDSNTCIGKLV
jgi:hypothetical protein